MCIRDSCGTDRVVKVSFADIVNEVLEHEEGKKIVSDFIKLTVFQTK